MSKTENRQRRENRETEKAITEATLIVDGSSGWAGQYWRHYNQNADTLYLEIKKLKDKKVTEDIESADIEEDTVDTEKPNSEEDTLDTDNSETEEETTDTKNANIEESTTDTEHTDAEENTMHCV